MEIPAGYDVYVYAGNENDKLNWEYNTDKGLVHMLVLVDGGKEDDYIAVYSINSFGAGDVDESAKLVRQKECPHCGKVMKLLWKGTNGAVERLYKCDCRVCK